MKHDGVRVIRPVQFCWRLRFSPALRAEVDNPERNRSRTLTGLAHDGENVRMLRNGLSYCPDITETVEIHLQTIREAVRSAALFRADGLDINRYPVSMSER